MSVPLNGRGRIQWDVAKIAAVGRAIVQGSDCALFHEWSSGGECGRCGPFDALGVDDSRSDVDG